MVKADVVFTGGYSLWEAKRRQHFNVHSVPSSVDIAHFAPAREALPECSDQASIGHPRLGFFGVIDERFDIELVNELATLRPDWQIVLIGPVVKIDPATLPRRPNVHYLGPKGYAELPAYLSGWDVALMPFAINESTRFSYEFSCADGDPYYPIPRQKNTARYNRYKALADDTPGVTFLGRLVTYKYYNMDQVVAQALSVYARMAGQPRRAIATA